MAVYHVLEVPTIKVETIEKSGTDPIVLDSIQIPSGAGEGKVLQSNTSGVASWGDAGTSGSSGTSGEVGATGETGTSGSSGTSGDTGTSGSSGTSGSLTQTAFDDATLSGTQKVFTIYDGETPYYFKAYPTKT